MVKNRIVLSLMLVAAFLSGCAKKQQIPSEPLALGQTDLKSAMQQAEKVLVWMNFAIDKADVENKIIRTKPLPAGQFFEFWRKDNQGGYNRHMANTHTIHRTAELKFVQNNLGLQIDCQVIIERMSVPEIETDVVARQYAMFSTSEETMQSFKLEKQQQENTQWINLGRDSSLERYILKKINQKINPKKGWW